MAKDLEARVRIEQEVKRFNRRLDTLAKRLGKQSPVYQKAVSKMRYNFGDNLRVNKEGVWQLARPAEIAQRYNMSDIKNIQVPTYGELKKEYEAGYEAIKKQKIAEGQAIEGGDISFSEYINTSMAIKENLGALYDVIEGHKEVDEETLQKALNANDILHMTKADLAEMGITDGKKTYEMLWEAAEVISAL